ncbi:MAG: peptidase, partial [Magnetococcales bacterium]|nr:peptidase [Magnetococcales bacterium]
MKTLTDIPIFQAGRHRDMSGASVTINEVDLQKTVSTYQPSLHEAPLVIGHPQHDAPAWGWVAKLRVENGTLLASVKQVDPDFSSTVSAGRYKKVSASFYTPDAPNNPVPGTYYLRHVGFLGAQPPALKGLGEASFNEKEIGIITISK